MVGSSRLPAVRVPKSMSHQPSLLSERFPTQRALEGLLAGVDSAVRLEVRGASETLPTLGTLEGPLPGVDQLMGQQVGILLEVFVADAAPELAVPVVRGQV